MTYPRQSFFQRSEQTFKNKVCEMRGQYNSEIGEQHEDNYDTMAEKIIDSNLKKALYKPSVKRVDAMKILKMVVVIAAAVAYILIHHK